MLSFVSLVQELQWVLKVAIPRFEQNQHLYRMQPVANI